jgi:amino acid transporter
MLKFSNSMAVDNELPAVFTAIHEKWKSPHKAIVFQFLFSGTMGCIGSVGGVVFLTAVTLASNVGTFLLYAMVCVAALAAFSGTEEALQVKFNDPTFKKSSLLHCCIPIVGLILNLVMV